VLNCRAHLFWYGCLRSLSVRFLVYCVPCSHPILATQPFTYLLLAIITQRHFASIRTIVSDARNRVGPRRSFTTRARSSRSCCTANEIGDARCARRTVAEACRESLGSGDKRAHADGGGYGASICRDDAGATRRRLAAARSVTHSRLTNACIESERAINTSISAFVTHEEML